MNAEEFVSGDSRLIALFSVSGIEPIRAESRRRLDTGKVKGLFIYARTSNLLCIHNQFLDGCPLLISPIKLLDRYQDTIRKLRALAASHKD